MLLQYVSSVLGNKKKKEVRNEYSLFSKTNVELFNFFTNHHPIRHLYIFFRILLCMKSNAYLTISSKNGWNYTMTRDFIEKQLEPNNQQHINDSSTTYPPTRYYPTSYRAMHTTTYSTTHRAADHTKRRTEQHTIHHTARHTKHQTTINQRAYPRRPRAKDL
jgi:hypothetical protein